MEGLSAANFRPIQLGWYKLNKAAIIPTKTENNAGFDIYTIEKDIVIQPHENHLFNTGLAAMLEPGWWFMAMDRGSTGSKDLHLHCGVVDNNYRGELFICIHNDNNYPVKFTNDEEPGLHTHKEKVHSTIGESSAYTLVEVEVIDYLVYPTSKAIAQIIPILQPKVDSRELSDAEWEIYKNTDRGDGKLGSSGK